MGKGVLLEMIKELVSLHVVSEFQGDQVFPLQIVPQKIRGDNVGDAPLVQGVNERAADEAGGTGNKNGFILQEIHNNQIADRGTAG
jgi:hypothetical protein